MDLNGSSQRLGRVKFSPILFCEIALQLAFEFAGFPKFLLTEKLFPPLGKSLPSSYYDIPFLEKCKCLGDFCAH